MESIQVTNRIKIVKQGELLLVEHELGDNFVLNIEKEIDIDTFEVFLVPEYQIFSICNRGRMGHMLFKYKIQELESFVTYVYDNQKEILEM